MPTPDPGAPAPSAEARRLIEAHRSAAARLCEASSSVAKCDAAEGALSAYVAGLEAEVAKFKDAAEDMVWQFAYCGTCDGRLVLHTGGLSALENAFDALDWPDPKPCPERECEAPDCHKEATCGTNTTDGYKRLCGEHFRTLGINAAAQRGRATEGGE